MTNIYKYKGLTTSVLSALMMLLVFNACNKDESPGFTPSFQYTMANDNIVKFTSDSDGEFYLLMWDFGNGIYDTTADHNAIQTMYFNEAGEYTVTLKLLNYTGETKSVSQKVNITNTDISLSFTSEIDPDNANKVILVNTTVGEYESFSWHYNDTIVENEIVYNAYFPYAGVYDVQLVVNKYGYDLSLVQQITINQDDPGNVPGFTLIWNDEFDYTGIPSSSNWNMETGGDGWGNNELQYYTDREENAYVDNGILTITAMSESYSGRDYTSARITTQNNFDVRYGKIEASIKLPYGQGIWPAFWMLGADIGSVGWPACGEIDIMELVGGDNNGDNTVYSTLHWENAGEPADYGQSYTLSSGVFADDFHEFAVEWDEEEIRGYVDGTEYFVADITPEDLSEFHNNFFIILNVAVGGNWPGSPNETTIFPQTMEVDYVRVYAFDE